MVEHTVQNNVDASCVSLAAQRAEVLLGAKHGVDGVVICRVVAVVAVRFKYGVEIDGGHRQALKIVQLLRDARQRSAEEIAVGDLSLLIRQEHRLVAPVVVDPPPAHHTADIRHRGAPEPVRKDLIRHALSEPCGSGRVLIHR